MKFGLAGDWSLKLVVPQVHEAEERGAMLPFLRPFMHKSLGIPKRRKSIQQENKLDINLDRLDSVVSYKPSSPPYPTPNK